ncbi:hypothetical protein ACTFIR_007158 [Dictyostelium discoideum]
MRSVRTNMKSEQTTKSKKVKKQLTPISRHITPEPHVTYKNDEEREKVQIAKSKFENNWKNDFDMLLKRKSEGTRRRVIRGEKTYALNMSRWSKLKEKLDTRKLKTEELIKDIRVGYGEIVIYSVAIDAVLITFHFEKRCKGNN